MPVKQRKQSAKSTTRQSTSKKSGKTKTDWARLEKLSDADIRRAIRSDSDAAPELDASWFRRAKLVIPEPKEAVSIRLDRDVIEWFRRHGKGYQTRINSVLRTYVDAHNTPEEWPASVRKLAGAWRKFPTSKTMRKRQVPDKPREQI